MSKIKKKNVLHIIADLGNGGAERQLIELLKVNKSDVLCIFTSAGIYKKTLIKYNIKYFELNIKRPFHIIFKMFLLHKIIKKSKAEIIHAWMYNACLISTIIKILFRFKLPIIWGIRCSNMELRHYALKLKLVVNLCKILSKKANYIVYNSFSGKEFHQNNGFSNSESSVIHNGVDNKRFKFSISLRKKLRKKYNFNSKDLVVLCVGRLDPMKNHKALLLAYEKIYSHFKNLKLVFIGKDTEALEAIGVLALGMKINIEKYYNMGDVIILPSSFGEGCPNVLLEGMLCKLFPVSTNVGDAKLIIEDTGLIIKTPAVNDIQKALTTVASMNKKELKKISENAV